MQGVTSTQELLSSWNTSSLYFDNYIADIFQWAVPGTIHANPNRACRAHYKHFSHKNYFMSLLVKIPCWGWISRFYKVDQIIFFFLVFSFPCPGWQKMSHSSSAKPLRPKLILFPFCRWKQRTDWLSNFPRVTQLKASAGFESTPSCSRSYSPNSCLCNGQCSWSVCSKLSGIRHIFKLTLQGWRREFGVTGEVSVFTFPGWV